MEYNKIATEYLVRILNSKNKQLEIEKVVEKILKKYGEQSSLIINDINRKLTELASQQNMQSQRRLGFKPRSQHQRNAQSNENYIEYMTLLNKAVEKIQKEGKR